MFTYNIDNHIKDLTQQAILHEKAGNDFLAACYRQAAERKTVFKKTIDSLEHNNEPDCRTLRDGRTRTVTATREFRTNEEIYDGLLCFDTEEVEETWEETFGESRCSENFRKEWYDYCSEYN